MGISLTDIANVVSGGTILQAVDIALNIGKTVVDRVTTANALDHEPDKELVLAKLEELRKTNDALYNEVQSRLVG